jgi:hypothetical protein
MNISEMIVAGGYKTLVLSSVTQQNKTAEQAETLQPLSAALFL